MLNEGSFLPSSLINLIVMRIWRQLKTYSPPHLVCRHIVKQTKEKEDRELCNLVTLHDLVT